MPLPAIADAPEILLVDRYKEIAKGDVLAVSDAIRLWGTIRERIETRETLDDLKLMKRAADRLRRDVAALGMIKNRLMTLPPCDSTDLASARLGHRSNK